MKSKSVKKKSVKKKELKSKKNKVVAEEENQVTENESKDDELPAEHFKGLKDALETSDIGKPVTLKEFKKMAKKWSTK